MFISLKVVLAQTPLRVSMRARFPGGKLAPPFPPAGPISVSARKVPLLLAIAKVPSEVILLLVTHRGPEFNWNQVRQRKFFAPLFRLFFVVRRTKKFSQRGEWRCQAPLWHRRRQATREILRRWHG
jgi:hypothetical protein